MNFTVRAGSIDDLGTLEPGKKADMRIVTGNPLVDLRVLYDGVNTNIVLKDGIVEYTDDEHKQYYSVGEVQPPDRAHAGEEY